MSQYEKLDKLIVERLRQGPMFLHFLCAHEVHVECVRIADATGREAFRIIDARLQALRKAGVIVYSSKTGWAIK